METENTIRKVVNGRVVTVKWYADRSKRWRWRTRSCNGQIVRCSGESFASRRNAKRAATKWG